MEESRDEQLDHTAGIVARIIVDTDAEVADATYQFVGINIGTDLASFRGGGEQLSAHGREAVKGGRPRRRAAPSCWRCPGRG